MPRKGPSFSAAYRCCYPVPTAGLTSLSRPIWSHIRSPVWSIDIYMYMFVRLLFRGWEGICWIKFSVRLRTKAITSLSFKLLLSASQDVWLDHPSCPAQGRGDGEWGRQIECRQLIDFIDALRCKIASPPTWKRRGHAPLSPERMSGPTFVPQKHRVAPGPFLPAHSVILYLWDKQTRWAKAGCVYISQ